MTPTAPTVADATYAVIAHIRAHGGVSFVEIEQVIARLGIPTQGDRGLFATGIDPNVLLWSGMTETTVEIMRRVMASHAVVVAPTHSLVYHIDGRVPAYPEYRQTGLPRHPLKRIYWLPVAFNGRA